MNDPIGQPINLGDIVSSTYYGSRVSAYIVVGYTPRKVRLLHYQAKNPNETILKFPYELIVIPNGEQTLTELEEKLRKEKQEA